MGIQTVEDKLERIHTNCYQLYLYNLELKYISEETNSDILNTFNNNDFLRHSIQSMHIHYCLLAYVLIHEKEHYSILQFIHKNAVEDRVKIKIINLFNDPKFQIAWGKIQKLRDKCFAHNDKEMKEIENQIKQTQKERDIIVKNLISSIKLIYSGYGGEIASFNFGDRAGIASILIIVKEWQENRIQKLRDEFYAERNKRMRLG